MMDNLQLTQFVRRLEKCEQIPDNLLSDWEVEFVQSMRDKFDGREAAMDLGVTPWSPTVKQLNQLLAISMQLAEGKF